MVQIYQPDDIANVQRVSDLVRKAKNIIAITGAGISTATGIPVSHDGSEWCGRANYP